MHPNVELIDRLYRSLAAHDPAAMAECYSPNATFEDIAFRLNGRQEIHDMWKFVTRPEPQLKASFEIVSADKDGVRAKLTDDYIFIDTKRPVHNVIDSSFTFENGLIFQHHDVCDPVLWANMAMTGANAWLAGHFRAVRSLAAKRKLRRFLREERRKSRVTGGH